MSKAITEQGNGAAIEETFSAKASERATVTQAGESLSTLAVAASLIARTMIEVGKEMVSVPQQLSQHATALTRAAGQSGKTSDAMSIREAVLPEINAAIAMLEQVCGKQLVFWNEVSRRVGTLHVLTEMIEAQVKSPRANSSTSS